MEGMVMDADFWRGRRVFVTGHTGFKGSWLSVWLRQLGAQVTGFALNPPTRPNLFEAASIVRCMRSLTGDVRDLASLRAAITDAAPEVIFHLAAQALVRRSYDAPVETYSSNVIGTANLLEAVRNSSALAIVVVTSDKCYDLLVGDKRYRENDPLGGNDPYSASKAGAELVAASYRASFGGTSATASLPPVASARAGNVIGGGDWAHDRLMPDLLATFSRSATASVREPDAVRPWQHVLDPLRAYLVLAQQLAQHGDGVAEAWNFGPGASSEWPVHAVCDEAARAWGGEARWQSDPSPHPHEAPVLRLDSEKARTRLGWVTQIPLREAIAHTVRWHKAFAATGDAGRLMQETIEELALNPVRA